MNKFLKLSALKTMYRLVVNLKNPLTFLKCYFGFTTKNKIHYKPLIRWIPIPSIKRQLIMMIGDLCSTISTELECVK